MNQLFTRDGSPALEKHLLSLCQEVGKRTLELMPSKSVQGIALGGGYGRGEGGVLHTADGDQPYNDLEFFVFVRGNAWIADLLLQPKLAKLAHDVSESAGIEVELKVLTLEKLRRSQPSMTYYDLMMGHRWVIGDDSLLEGCEHHRDATQIPLMEATRLMMNRCSGLLFAKERLTQSDFDPLDSDFVARNIAKAWLAIGDSILAALGQYHWSCVERGRRLSTLENLPLDMVTIREMHKAGVEFKLHPVQAHQCPAELLARHGMVSNVARSVWLWIEARRLALAHQSLSDYSLRPNVICKGHSLWKNLIQNLRAPRVPNPIDPLAFRYPRERLLRSLPLLLWGMKSPEDEHMVRRCLQCDSLQLPQAVQAYFNLWQKFN